MGTANGFQILYEAGSISRNTNTLLKGMDSIILPACYGLILEQSGLFNIGTATSLGEGKHRIQTCCTPIKIYHVLFKVEGLCKYNSNQLYSV